MHLPCSYYRWPAFCIQLCFVNKHLVTYLPLGSLFRKKKKKNGSNISQARASWSCAFCKSHSPYGNLIVLGNDFSHPLAVRRPVNNLSQFFFAKEDYILKVFPRIYNYCPNSERALPLLRPAFAATAKSTKSLSRLRRHLSKSVHDCVSAAIIYLCCLVEYGTEPRVLSVCVILG